MSKKIILAKTHLKHCFRKNLLSENRARPHEYLVNSANFVGFLESMLVVMYLDAVGALFMFLLRVRFVMMHFSAKNSLNTLLLV